MRRSAWLVMMATLCTGTLSAQATVIQPEAPLDSARAGLRDALLVLRDSLMSVDGAAARLQRDFRQTSAASLLSRARVMHDACARSVRTVPPTRETLLAADLSEPLGLKRRRELVQALDRLRDVLSRCEANFAAMSRPGEGETVRGYAYGRSEVVQTAIRKYEENLREFFTALGIYVSPAGSNPRTTSG
ncbi:MAG TPA: hypothetical protein VGN76_00795 [Gemmatimonadales bacterium]|nr:hypothetical protein [Gemmatimonadales bacterium]